MTLAATVNLMADAPVGQVVEAAVEAERLGFARCWLYDEGVVTRDVYVTATAIATGTSRILVGPGITNPYTRHPATTAAAIASLDEWSGGRAFLGLGPGGGLTLGPLAIDRRQPLASLAEMVDTTRRLWAGDEVTHAGATFSYRQAGLAYGRPDIEIWMAGRGPRLVELGGQVADGFHLSFVHHGTMAATVARLREATARAGRTVRLSYSTMLVTSEAARREARAQLSFRLPDSPPEVREQLGLSADDVERLRTALADGGPTAAAPLVRDEWLAQFVVMGTVEESAAQLAALAVAHGIDEYQLPVLHPAASGPMMSEAAEVVARVTASAGDLTR